MGGGGVGGRRGALDEGEGGEDEGAALAAGGVCVSMLVGWSDVGGGGGLREGLLMIYLCMHAHTAYSRQQK